MIDKLEILETAKTIELLPSVVEKDYAIGWVLAGIYNHPLLSAHLLFKGGTCIKKCYFADYRFSEDLDFTVYKATSDFNIEVIESCIKEVGQWVYQSSGIEILYKEPLVKMYKNKHDIIAAQGQIYFGGPIAKRSRKSWPLIKLDITFEEHVFKPATKPIWHKYSDQHAFDQLVMCYSYEDLLAEKIRALGERARPRDLYDVVNLYNKLDAEISVTEVADTLQKKCKFKNIPTVQLSHLEHYHHECQTGWHQQLSHQVQNLASFESYWSQLPAVFSWLNQTEPVVKQSA